MKRDANAETYVEKLMDAILADDPTRVGMAIDVLTMKMHEPRALIPMRILLRSPVDAHRLVMAARGLGRLGNPEAIPDLIAILQNPEQPFVARTEAARALGQLDGPLARRALEQARSDPRPSVARAAEMALHEREGNHDVGEQHDAEDTAG